MDFLQNYLIKDREQLENYINTYITKTIAVGNNLGINLHEKRFLGDHVGLQVLDAKEFDTVSDVLKGYSSLIHDTVIHNRRNRIFEFNQTLETDGISIPRIEIFEPKPNADLKKLRPGIEHIAFKVGDYGDFLAECQNRGIAIDKIIEYNGSKFFKTAIVDGIEIEFRNDLLGRFD